MAMQGITDESIGRSSVAATGAVPAAGSIDLPSGFLMKKGGLKVTTLPPDPPPVLKLCLVFP